METLFIGKNMLFLTEVDSTNTYATNLLRNVNIHEGTIVYTDKQTQGRGQRGATWVAETGANITASVILRPTFLGVSKSFYLSKISALALHDVMAEFLNHSQYDIKIKWPNDILVNNKKIAGILIENQFNGSIINTAVVGIGLNVNQQDFGDLKNTSISLSLLSNSVFDRTEVLKKLAVYIEKWYLLLKAGKTELIDTTYLNYLFGYNILMSFKNELCGNDFMGTITGVSATGKLLIEDTNKKHLEFEVKEVKPYID